MTLHHKACTVVDGRRSALKNRCHSLSNHFCHGPLGLTSGVSKDWSTLLLLSYPNLTYATTLVFITTMATCHFKKKIVERVSKGESTQRKQLVPQPTFTSYRKPYQRVWWGSSSQLFQVGAEVICCLTARVQPQGSGQGSVFTMFSRRVPLQNSHLSSGLENGLGDHQMSLCSSAHLFGLQDGLGTSLSHLSSGKVPPRNHHLPRCE